MSNLNLGNLVSHQIYLKMCTLVILKVLNIKHFSSTLQQHVNGNNFGLSYKTQSHKTAHETLNFQGRMLPLQTYDVQAILLQSGRVTEMNFPVICRLKLQKCSLW